MLAFSHIYILDLAFTSAEETETEPPKVDEDAGKSRDASKTDDEVVQREEEAINIDGLSVAEMKQMRESAEKHAFQAEVSRMMKLIINSLYKNKEVSILYKNLDQKLFNSGQVVNFCGNDSFSH